MMHLVNTGAPGDGAAWTDALESGRIVQFQRAFLERGRALSPHASNELVAPLCSCRRPALAGRA